MSSQKSSRETICWLDVAAMAAQREAVDASIYPVNVGNDAPSFAITIGHCWIVGGDGGLSVFDSPQAARRFLELLGIAKVTWKGSGTPPKLPDQSHFRRFYLSRYKLTEETDSKQPSTDKSVMRMMGLHEGKVSAPALERPTSDRCIT